MVTPALLDTFGPDELGHLFKVVVFLSELFLVQLAYIVKDKPIVQLILFL